MEQLEAERLERMCFHFLGFSAGTWKSRSAYFSSWALRSRILFCTEYMIDETSVGSFEVSCDTCGITEEFDCDYNWDLLMQKMKEFGWINRKDANHEGYWEHFCEDCARH